MSEADILNQLKIVAREHIIKVVEGQMEETMPASIINELRLNNFSAKILLDYITNLQEKNEELEEYFKSDMEIRAKLLIKIDGLNYSLEQAYKDIKELQEENERLKCVDDSNRCLRSANDTLDERCHSFHTLYEDYKSRNEKAIAYIECGKTFDDIETARIIDKYEKILLEILQGSDKDD